MSYGLKKTIKKMNIYKLNQYRSELLSAIVNNMLAAQNLPAAITAAIEDTAEIYARQGYLTPVLGTSFFMVSGNRLNKRFFAKRSDPIDADQVYIYNADFATLYDSKLIFDGFRERSINDLLEYVIIAFPPLQKGL